MKFDPEASSLHFDSAEDAERFHLELSVLVREVMMQASTKVDDADRAVELSREVLKEFKASMRVLNAMRRALPKTGGTEV